MRLILSTGVILAHSYEVVAGEKVALIVCWTGWPRPFVALILPMFFALSGFLVAGSLERNKSIISFLGLRIIRLVPALSVEVTLSALILGPLFTGSTLYDYYSNPQFFHYFANIFGDIHYVLPGVFENNPLPDTVNSQLWTIPFELKCYGLLTLIACFGLFGPKRILLVSALSLYLIIIGHMLKHYRVDPPVLPQTFAGALLVVCFLCGVTMYRWRSYLPYNGYLAILSAVLTIVTMLVPVYGDFLTPVPATYLTVYLGLLNPPRRTKLLSGDYSYGMYLYGYPIQQAFTSFGNWTHLWVLNFIVCWPLSLGVAVLSWHFVEKPAFSLKILLYKIETLALSVKLFLWYSERVFVAHRTTIRIRDGALRS